MRLFCCPDVEAEDVEGIIVDLLWRSLGRGSGGFEADSHIEDVSLGGGLWWWLWIGLHGWDIDHIEDVIIHDVLRCFFLLWLSGRFGLGLFGLSLFGLPLFGLPLFWLFGGGHSSFSLLLVLFIFGDDVVIVVDGAGAGHLECLDIKIHVSFSDGDVLECFDGGLEGGDGDANFLLSVSVPVVLE